MREVCFCEETHFSLFIAPMLIGLGLGNAPAKPDFLIFLALTL
jgi:hypothetical protein